MLTREDMLLAICSSVLKYKKLKEELFEHDMAPIIEGRLSKVGAVLIIILQLQLKKIVNQIFLSPKNIGRFLLVTSSYVSGAYHSEPH